MSETQQEETVWVSGYWNKRKYHTDPNCQNLNRANNKIQISKREDLEQCAICDDENNVMEEGQANYKMKDCPYCGETVKRLPSHLPCEQS